MPELLILFQIKSRAMELKSRVPSCFATFVAFACKA